MLFSVSWLIVVNPCHLYTTYGPWRSGYLQRIGFFGDLLMQRQHQHQRPISHVNAAFLTVPACLHCLWLFQPVQWPDVKTHLPARQSSTHIRCVCNVWFIMLALPSTMVSHILTFNILRRLHLALREFPESLHKILPMNLFKIRGPANPS